jgi:hypothetical protein
MIVLGYEQVLAHSNLFTYYEQVMTKSTTRSLIITIMFIKDNMNLGRLRLQL